MKYRSISRRTWLRGAAGAAALALPWLEALTPSSARASGSSAPKRVVFFVTPNGFPMEHWKCAVDPSNPTAFTLSPVLAPLAPHKQDCLFIAGVPMSSSFDPNQNATAHEGGCASVLTGTWAGEGTMFGGGSLKSGFAISESIDGYLGKKIGQATRYPAYHLGVLPTGPTVTSRPFNAGKDQPVSPNVSPFDAYKQLFGELFLDAELAKKRHVERKRVIDGSGSQLQKLRCQLGQDDKHRLDLHLQSLETIAKGLGKLPSASCTAPAIGNEISTSDAKLYPTLGKLQIDLLVAALSCDITRVMGLQWHTPGSNITYSWLGHDEEHHDLSHKTTTEAKQRLAEIGAWYAEQLAYLVTRLKATPDGDGTLFDNTLIVWVAECGDPWLHDRKDVGFTLIGSCQKFFKTGRYLAYSGTTAHNHNRLLLSVAECMGQATTEFGAQLYSSYGPLTGLTA